MEELLEACLCCVVEEDVGVWTVSEYQVMEPAPTFHRPGKRTQEETVGGKITAYMKHDYSITDTITPIHSHNHPSATPEFSDLH